MYRKPAGAPHRAWRIVAASMGTRTPIQHPDYDDVYFHAEDGLAEAEYVFLRGNALARRFAALADGTTFVLGETGFGTGRAVVAAILLFEATAPPSCRLVVHSLELDPLDFEIAAAQLTHWPALHARHEALRAGWPTHLRGVHAVASGNPRVELYVWVGDAAATLNVTSFRVNAWFLDGFAPAKNPRMWSDGVLQGVAHNSAAGATFATYTAAGFVRRGLEAAGFETARPPGFGDKRQMLTGRLVRPSRRRWDKVSARYPTVEPRRCRRVVVVGAGIAGAATARELAARGVEVTVLEAARVASGASGNPAALLEAMVGDANNTPAQWISQGFLAGCAAARRWHLPSQWHWAVHRGERAAQQHRKVVEGGHPDWVRPVEGGFLLRSLLISPVEWVQRLLDGPGITVREGERVTSLTEVAERFQADAVVLANSAAAQTFAAHLPMRWVRGQLGWSTQDRGIVRPLCASKYVLPMVDGRQVWGASFGQGETTLELRDAENAAIVRELASVFASVPETVEMAGARASLRGVTDGRLPYVGPLFDSEEAMRTRRGDGRPVFGRSAVDERVWLTVAHGSRGFCSSFAGAWLLAEALGGAPHRIPKRLAAAVHPGRVVFRSRAS